MTLVRVAIVLVALAVPLLAFGWWGMNTAAGQRAYDEMAGMIPFWAGVLGGLLLAAAAVLGVVMLVRRG